MCKNMKPTIMWKCREIDGIRIKPLNKPDYKRGCGKWQVMSTNHLSDSNLQGTCNNCGKRQRLNLGNIHQGFTDRKHALKNADDLNKRDGWVEVIEYTKSQHIFRISENNAAMGGESPKGNSSPPINNLTKKEQLSVPKREWNPEEDWFDD